MGFEAHELIGDKNQGQGDGSVEVGRGEKGNLSSYFSLNGFIGTLKKLNPFSTWKGTVPKGDRS